MYSQVDGTYSGLSQLLLLTMIGRTRPPHVAHIVFRTAGDAQVLSLALNAIGSVGASELAGSLRRGACRALEVSEAGYIIQGIAARIIK